MYCKAQFVDDFDNFANHSCENMKKQGFMGQ
jgi:hypothetical protein